MTLHKAMMHLKIEVITAEIERHILNLNLYRKFQYVKKVQYVFNYFK